MSTEEDVFQAEKFQEAIAATGFGKFNIILLVVSFFGTMAIIFASTTVSFIMPTAECDLDLSLAEQGLLNSMAYYGMLVSGVPWAILSDFQGRKIVLVVAHVLDAISVFICALSQGSIQLMIFKFINGMCISGGYSCMMTYLSETHSEKYRQIVLLVIGLFLAISALLLPLSAMLILPAKWIIDIGGFAFRSWNLYIALTAIPSLVVGIAFIILPESPKYSMRRKRYDIANETFATIYHFNTGEPKDNYPVTLPPRADAGIIRTIRSSVQLAKNNIVTALTSGAICQMLLVCLIDFCVLMSQNTLRLWKPSFFAAARNFDFSNSTTICPFLDTFVEDQKIRASGNTTKHDSCSFILDQRSYLANVFVSLVSIVGYVAAIVLVRKVGIKLLLGNMKINAKMATPIEEKVDQNLKIRTGMVNVSDGKSKPEPLRLNLTMELVTLQRLEVVTPTNTQHNGPPMESKERMVQITRQKEGGLGLSIKGGAEHKLPILISRIYKDQAADITGQLFVGDAIIKVNGEYITACPHDDAVNILRNAGDIVVLTVKHYRAATPFLQKQLAKETPDSDNDATCAELKADEGYKSSVNNGTISRSCSRPMSICSEPEKKWVDVVAVPLMMAYVTRYIYGTDKLRHNAFEVRGLNGASTGIIHCDDLAILSQWLKLITDNVVGLTHLQMKLYNRNFAVGERIEYMGWVNEGVINNNISWQSYKPRFLVLKGTEVMLFETPPLNVAGLSKALVAYKVYQTMFRVVKESETVDSRQHCFLLQSSGHEPRYLSVETRQELLRIENSWNAAIVTSVIKLGRKTFAVSHHGKSGGLTLDWQSGFSLAEGADSAIVWHYKFSQLRGSSDDGKSKLKLHFQDHETRAIETKELECQVLQSLLFCMHAFLTAKVASVDPAFLSSIQQT